MIIMDNMTDLAYHSTVFVYAAGLIIYFVIAMMAITAAVYDFTIAKRFIRGIVALFLSFTIACIVVISLRSVVVSL